MNRRAIAVVAVLYIAAVAVWVLVQMRLTIAGGRDVLPVALQGARALLLVQALVAAVLAPVLAVESGARELPWLAALQVLALPLVSFLWLTGVSARALVVGTACVIAATWTMAALARAVAAAARRSSIAGAAIVGLQAIGGAVVLRFEPIWLRWIGL
jgi:hypothetical protein